MDGPDVEPGINFAAFDCELAIQIQGGFVLLQTLQMVELRSQETFVQFEGEKGEMFVLADHKSYFILHAAHDEAIVYEGRIQLWVELVELLELFETPAQNKFHLN